VARGPDAAETRRLQVNISAGYQQENFHWSIAGNSSGQDPNVYSELKWQRISGPALRAALHWNPYKKWQLFADGSRVFTTAGRVQDRDYGLDNRNDVLYDQRFDSHQGYGYSAAAAVGYRLVERPRWQFTPFIGYGLDGQSLSILDPGGMVAFLNSRYTAKWKGLLVRTEASGQFGRRRSSLSRWYWEASLTYDQADYSATADWNLISQFAHPVSFRHTADGYGLDAKTALHYRIGRHIALRAGPGFFTWQTGTGIDALYLSAGGTDKTRLNGVSRNGWTAEAGIILF
jgi:hypothetical protein